jgi:hypothetical protein
VRFGWHLGVRLRLISIRDGGAARLYKALGFSHAMAGRISIHHKTLFLSLQRYRVNGTDISILDLDTIRPSLFFFESYLPVLVVNCVLCGLSARRFRPGNGQPLL